MENTTHTRPERHEMAKRVMRGILFAAGHYRTVRSVLIHSRDEASMMAALEHLQKTAPEWFRRNPNLEKRK